MAKPAGAVKVTTGSLKTAGGVTCAKIGGRWVAGSIPQRGYFLAFSTVATRLRSQAAKQAGAKKRATIAKAKAADQKSAAGARTCNRAATAAGASSGGATAAPPQSVHFAVDQAVILGVRGAPRRRAVAPRVGSQSTMLAVDATGRAWDPVDAGTASVTDVFVNSGLLYAVFASDTLVGSEARCRFAVASTATGDASCISVRPPMSTATQMSYIANPVVQFDAAGNAYFLQSSTQTPANATSLARYGGGTLATLWQGDVRSDIATSFLVRGDGTVFLSGVTVASSNWVRRVAAGLSSVILSQHGTFLAEFADGNVYFGSANTFPGVFRYLAGAGVLDTNRWIGSGANVTNDICGGSANPRFCASTSGPSSTGGAYVRAVLLTSGPSAYAIATRNPPGITGGDNGDVVMRYYPSVEEVASVVERYGSGVSAGAHAVISGTDAAGRSILSVLSGSSETLVVAPGTITVIALAYAEGTGVVTATGTRSSDGAAVIARFDPANPGGVVITRAGAVPGAIAAVR